MMTAETASLTVAVLSDTHGQCDYLAEALRLLEPFAPACILHCGDIGTPEIVEGLARWPTHYVFGNCDDDRQALRAAIHAVGHTCHERFGTLELAGRRIAWTHGDDTSALVRAIEGGQYDLVCHGHTHVARWELVGRTRVLNPGALYRANPRSLAVLELPALERTTLAL